MKQYTDITILLDRSGSMESIKSSMEEAINSLVREHRVNPTTKLTLVQFDDINPYDVVYQSVPVSSVETLKLQPRGSTPLLDSLCTTIDKLGQRYANMVELDRPDQVLLIIITDGQENASRTYTRSDVFNRITKQRNDYKWQFVYLGANQDVFMEAASFGIPKMHTLGYTASTGGVRGMSRGLVSTTTAYTSTSGSARGTAVMDSFTDKQREDAVD